MTLKQGRTERGAQPNASTEQREHGECRSAGKGTRMPHEFSSPDRSLTAKHTAEGR
jgi:hypothetical protein